MHLEIREVGADSLRQYAEIPVAFEVRSVFRVDLLDDGLGGIRLQEEQIATPYVKDYDGSEDGGPERELKRFDIRNWGIFLALKGERAVGGAVVAFDTPGVHMLQDRSDIAVLWDIRVHPDLRRCGIGSRLFGEAGNWARKRACRLLKVETQNVNIAACRFYASQGCRLGEINRYGYAGHPQVGHEVKLVWCLDL